MANLQVGDVVLPEEYREFEGAFREHNLVVTNVFKNGNIKAKSKDGRWTSHGPAFGFYKPNFA